MRLNCPSIANTGHGNIVKKFASKYNLVPTLCDGCMLGVRDRNDLPIKKSWQISCTFPLLRLQAQVCDRSHSHGESRGPDLKRAEEYTFDMVDAIHSDWKDHALALEKQACKGEDNSRQSQTLAACAILAGLASTPSVMMGVHLTLLSVVGGRTAIKP